MSVTPKKKKTPFADSGAIAGKRIGRLLGLGDMSGVGRFLGSGIGSIMGSGDYQVTGPTPGYNVLSGQIPKFSTTSATNIISHREYLGDINGTAAFNLLQYPLNPGVATTFPWLSTIAPSYQQYRFHSVVFEFRSLITDFVTAGAPGVVIMSTNYNSDAPVYTTKVQMENTEFAVSTKPTINLMHMVECAPSQTSIEQLYVRNGPVPTGQDLRLYDLGLFQLATSNNPVQDLGELYVTYVVEFFKPIIGASSPNFEGRLIGVGATSAAPFGVTSTTSSGYLNVVFSGTTATITNAVPGQVYLVDYTTVGGAVATTAFSIACTSGGTSFSLFNAGTASLVTAPTGSSSVSGNTLSNYSFSASSPTVVLTWSAGVIGTANVDCFIVAIHG
jgi:hypothetical protein